MSHACNTYPTHASNMTHSGINILGEVPWGSHFCEFYENEQDLLDVLILYFMEGLANNECCFWISANQKEHLMVYQALKNSIPGIDAILAQGKMYLLDRKKVMPDYTTRVATNFINTFIETQKKLVTEGFTGVRAAGSAGTLSSQKERDQFAQYESMISKAIQGHKIIALCCYSLNECNSTDIIRVIKNHEFSLIRSNNDWEMLEKTSIKITKNQMHKVSQELDQLVNQRTENLLTALHSRDQFIAIASHELKTPIAALRLYADGMLRSQNPAFGLPDKIKFALQKIQEQSVDLEVLLNNLLDVTGFEKDGLLAANLVSVDLVKLAESVITRFNVKYDGQENLITLKAPESLLCHCDSLRLKQVLENLIENALKYSSNQPVVVSLSRKNKQALLAVKDRGIGIAKVNQKEIFKRFVQLRNKNFVGGFGLGLWIVKQIVEAHRGKITVESTPGKGTEFTVSLPLEMHNG